MKYLVLQLFRDKETSVKHFVGTTYETFDENRAKELQNKGFIGEEIPNNDEPAEEKSKQVEDVITHVGGGYYELPNGEKIKGKEAAQKALMELENETKVN